MGPLGHRVKAAGDQLTRLGGTFFLHHLDSPMEQQGLFYLRIMDDILALAPTCWKLRRAVRAVNGYLAALDLETFSRYK